jgi:hypothetical protein
MSRGPLGRVADLGDGKSFSAHVEYDESEGPFSFMNGPNWAEAGVAVGWARLHAPRVVVRVGSEFLSAGEEPYRDAPAWPGPYCAPGGVGAGEGGPVRAWFAEAQLAWFRADVLEVAERLAEAVRGAPEASDAGFGRTESGFRVTFVVTATAEVEANEVASTLLRAAWAATRIEATPGDDFDGDSISVREDPPAAAPGFDCPV